MRSFGLAVHGAYTPFLDVAREQLRTLDPEIASGAVDDILAAFHRLAPYPDVRPAFEGIRASGGRIITLTNGSVGWIAALLLVFVPIAIRMYRKLT